MTMAHLNTQWRLRHLCVSSSKSKYNYKRNIWANSNAESLSLQGCVADTHNQTVRPATGFSYNEGNLSANLYFSSKQSITIYLHTLAPPQGSEGQTVEVITAAIKSRSVLKRQTRLHSIRVGSSVGTKSNLPVVYKRVNYIFVPRRCVKASR